MGKFTKYQVMSGAMLLLLPNALPWYMGNVLTYAYSYFRCNLGNHDAYGEIIWLLPIFFPIGVLAVVSLDLLTKFVPLRLTLAAAILFHDLGLMLTYFTVQRSVWTAAITLSACVGIGYGLMLMAGFRLANQWFPENVGVATSVVSSACGVGAIIFNAVTTAFLNPDNVEPDVEDETVSYFSRPEINDRFPTLFLILGVMSAISHSLAFCILFTPLSHTTTKANSDDGNGGTSPVRLKKTLGETTHLTENTTVDLNHLENVSYTQERITPDHIDGGIRRIIGAKRLDQQPLALTSERKGGHDQNKSFHHVNASCTQEIDPSLDRCKECSHQIIEAKELDRRLGLTTWRKEDKTDQKNSIEEVRQHSLNTKPLTVIEKSPLDVLRSELFYHLWFGSVSMTIAFVTVSNNYKLFGQLWIKDDQFFVHVGTVANVATVVCRLSVGLLIDRLGIFNAIIFMMMTNSILMIFWFFVVQIDRWFYLLWTALLIGLQGSSYTSYPVAVLKFFGKSYYSTNTGLMYSALMTGSLVTPPLTSFFVTEVGWFWLFFLSSASSVVGATLLIIRASPLTADTV